MEYGFYLPNSGAGVEPNALSDIAKLGDRLGFFCMVMPDHVLQPNQVNSTYPYSLTGDILEAGHKCDDHPLPEPYPHSQDAFNARYAIKGPAYLGGRRRLDERRIRTIEHRTLRRAWGSNQRISASVHRTLDQRQPNIRRQIRQLLRHNVLAQASTETTSAHLDRRTK